MKNKLTKSCVALALFNICLNGQNEGAENQQPDVLEPFSVIGSKENISNLPGSGYYIDSKELEIFNYLDINQILKTVPGVYLRSEEGYGLFPNISLRGVDPNRSSKVTILEDGVPSSPSPFSDPSAYYSPTSGRMSGFEVLKGSSQIKLGPNTTGGVINYLSTPIPQEVTSYFRGSYGSNNERTGHAYAGGQVELDGSKLGYLFELFDTHTDGWKTINALADRVSSNAPVSKTDIMLKLSYELSESSYLEFKFGRTDLDGDVSYIGLTKSDFAVNPYQRYAGTLYDNMDSDQERMYLRYLNEFSDSSNLAVTIFRNEFNRDWYKIGKVKVGAGGWNSIGKGAFGTTGVRDVLNGTTSGQVKYKHNDRSYVNTGVQANYSFEVGEHALDAGFRYTDDHYTYKDYTEDIYNIGTTGLSYDSTSTGSKGTGKDRMSKVWEWYLEDELKFGEITITPGLRYTRASYEYKGNEKILTDILLGAGATYKIDDGLTFFGGVHQGHAMPGYGAASGDISEEQSLGIELGARGEAGIFNYEVAYFNTSIDDMLAIPSLGSGLGDDAINIGEASSSGFEALISTDLNRNGEFSVPVGIAVTWTNAEFESTTRTDGESRYEGGASGNAIPFIPDLQYNLRAGLVYDKFSTFLNYSYQDSVFVNASNTAENGFDAKIDSYSVLDWSATYQISEDLSVFGKVTNLTDKDYAVSDLPEGLRPGAPRLFQLGASYKF
ncbi:MAG: TonB-dependent receptor [Opitutae bacterium]|nr:TonB-dependent receptor [Opitutae bacterium]MBT5691284.1 TonB-dependent receptor [Opitutae bacterium]MBT6462318.1 TonB-dependent receptor [Opitutae bacterium]MBT7854391.1 TonB-dependent receptor [Opitutae bacterium]